MVVALTGRQWTALVQVTGTAEAFQSLEGVTGHDVSSEDGRFGARDLIAAVLRPWFEARTLDEVRAAFAGTGVSWGPYQTFRQLVEEDPRASEANPMFSTLEQPGIGSYLVPASPLDFTAAGRLPARRAPLLGEHTEEILADVLGLGGAEIGRLYDAGTVAGAAEPVITGRYGSRKVLHRRPHRAEAEASVELLRPILVVGPDRLWRRPPLRSLRGDRGAAAAAPHVGMDVDLRDLGRPHRRRSSWAKATGAPPARPRRPEPPGGLRPRAPSA